MTDISPLGRNDAIDSDAQSDNTVTVTNLVAQQQLLRPNAEKIAPETGASPTSVSGEPLAPSIDDDPIPTVASLADPDETAPGATETPFGTKPENTPVTTLREAKVSTSAADLGGPLTGNSTLGNSIVTPGNTTSPDIRITTTPAQQTDRVQAEQIQLGNTGRVELVPSTPVGDLKVNVRADITLPNPPLDSRTDTNPPAGESDRQFTTGTFNIRATAVTPDKLVVTGSVGLSVDPAKPEPLRSISPRVEIFQLGENNGLGGAGAGITLSRTGTDDLYFSGANLTGRVQLNGSTDIFAGPVVTFSAPGKPNGDSLGGTIGIVQRAQDGKDVRQTTTSVTVSVPDTGGVSITGSYTNGERNRFLGTDPDVSLSVQYTNKPGVDSRFQIGVQLFNLP